VVFKLIHYIEKADRSAIGIHVQYIAASVAQVQLVGSGLRRCKKKLIQTTQESRDLLLQVGNVFGVFPEWIVGIMFHRREPSGLLHGFFLGRLNHCNIIIPTEKEEARVCEKTCQGGFGFWSASQGHSKLDWTMSLRTTLDFLHLLVHILFGETTGILSFGDGKPPTVRVAPLREYHPRLLGRSRRLGSATTNDTDDKEGYDEQLKSHGNVVRLCLVASACVSKIAVF